MKTPAENPSIDRPVSRRAIDPAPSSAHPSPRTSAIAEVDVVNTGARDAGCRAPTGKITSIDNEINKLKGS